MAGLSKPHALSCARNRDPILAVLMPILSRSPPGARGSAAVPDNTRSSFAGRCRTWDLAQSSDVEENLPGIKLWLNEARLPNLAGTAPSRCRALHGHRCDTTRAFSANTLHIMSWPEQRLVRGTDHALEADGARTYGPLPIHLARSPARAMRGSMRA